jgi:hypothetical protein
MSAQVPSYTEVREAHTGAIESIELLLALSKKQLLGNDDAVLCVAFWELHGIMGTTVRLAYMCG